MKKKKPKWTKGTSHETAYQVGRVIGARDAFYTLAEEGDIDPSTIAWLLEKEYMDRITKDPK